MKYVERIIEGELPPAPRAEEFCVLMCDGKARAVDFACPCGCGLRYYLPVTDKDAGEKMEKPKWHFWRPLTLHPSVRHLRACKAHFNVTNGESYIHGDSGK